MEYTIHTIETAPEDTKAKQRIEELVADVTRLQQSGMRLQQDLISQIQTEETRRKTQIER